MIYGLKYIGSGQSLDGSTYTAEIWKKAHANGVTTIVPATPAFVVQWGQQGDDVYTPIRPSSAELLVFDKAKVLQAEIKDADEELFRLLILKGANVYWNGKILTDVFEDSLNLRPESTKISAIDGLGQLENYAFDNVDRVSIVQCAADLLKKIGLGLNIRFASNWFTPDILASEDPLARIYTERLAERGDSDEILSAREVFEEYLLRFGLQLHQSDNVWWVIQRELLGAASFKYFEYDQDGVFVTSVSNYNPAVTIAEDAQYGKRLSDGRRPYKKAFKTTTVIYTPKAVSVQIPNGDFEDWPDPNQMPTGWTKSDPALEVIRTGEAMEGVYSAQLSIYAGSYKDDPPPYHIDGEAGAVSATGRALWIKLAAAIIPSESLLALDYYHPSPTPRKAYFSIYFGDYFLKRHDRVNSWKLNSECLPYEDLIVFNDVGLQSPSIGTQTWELITPELPQNVGLLTVRLWQAVEFEYSGSEPMHMAVKYDAFTIDVIKASGDVAAVTGTKTVSNSVVLPNSVNRDEATLRIGDGPTSATISHLTIGFETPTGNWKRGPYGAEQPTNTTIDEMLAQTWLRAQKQPLEIHNATYIARSAAGALIEAHNVLVIGSKRYAFSYLERDLLAGHSGGEWVEIRADDDDLVTTVEAIVEESGENVVKRDTKYGDGNVVGSKTYADGFLGSGWRIEKVNGKYKLTIDMLDVRGSASFAELLFLQKRVFNGSLIVGRTGTGKVKKVEEILIGGG